MRKEKRLSKAVAALIKFNCLIFNPIAALVLFNHHHNGTKNVAAGISTFKTTVIITKTDSARQLQ